MVLSKNEVKGKKIAKKGEGRREVRKKWIEWRQEKQRKEGSMGVDGSENYSLGMDCVF
jgi:hypothetical protein